MDASFIDGMEHKHYLYDYTTEGLIADGEMLMVGMKILVEPDALRQDLREWASWDAQERKKALQHNRWCTVGDLTLDTDNSVVHFIGTYEGGMRVRWIMPVTVGYYVKLDSIQEVKDRIVQGVERMFWNAVGLEKPQPPTEMGDVVQDEGAQPTFWQQLENNVEIPRFGGNRFIEDKPGMWRSIDNSNEIGDGPKLKVENGTLQIGDGPEVAFSDMTIAYHGAPGTSVQVIGPGIDGEVVKTVDDIHKLPGTKRDAVVTENDYPVFDLAPVPEELKIDASLINDAVLDEVFGDIVDPNTEEKDLEAKGL